MIEDEVLKRISKLEGELHSFLLKSQEDDKKLDKINKFTSDLEGFKKLISQEKEIIDLKLGELKSSVDVHHNHAVEANQKFNVVKDYPDIIQDLEKKVNLILNKIANELSPKINKAFELFEKTESKAWIINDHLKGLAESVGLISDDVISNQNQFETKESVKSKFDDLNSKFDKLSSQMSGLKDSFDGSSKSLISEFERHKNSTEYFKSNIATIMTKSFESIQDSISNKLQEFKPKDYSTPLKVINDDVIKLKQENDLKDDKLEVCNKELEVIQRKIEKLFILLKKLELSKEQ